MINNRLLREFKSGNDSTVIIEDILCTTDSCGQEVLVISTKKIRTPYKSIIQNYDVTSKTLEVEGQLELNSNKEYYTNLVGFISNESNTSPDKSTLSENDILNDKYTSPTSHNIEEIKTSLEKEITITFNKEYEKQPHIIITIDKEYEDLYRSYSTKFIKNDTETKYLGVVITFNNLRAKLSYPEIGVCVIGDAIESYYDGIVKTETTTNIHIFTQESLTEIHIFEMIDMVKSDVKNTTVIITDKDGNSTTYTTDNCGSITPILKYGEYTIQIDDEKYKNDVITIKVTPSNTQFDLEVFLKLLEE